jgi:hypothetical protein
MLRPGLRLHYTPGPADALKVEIEAEAIRFTGTASAPTFTLELDRTYDDLKTQIEAQGITVTLDTGLGSSSALTLVPHPLTSVPLTAGGALILQRWTNPLYRFWHPIARRLERESDKIDDAIDQLNMLLAAGHFADFWGELSSTVRGSGEDDSTYTTRQRHELIRRRDTNQALAAILEEDFGVTVEQVDDLRPQVFRFSATPMRGYPLAGDRYNADSVFIRIREFPTRPLLAAINRHIAAGITAFLRGSLLTPAVGIGGGIISTLGVDPGLSVIGTQPDMQISTGTIEVGRIGS